MPLLHSLALLYALWLMYVLVMGLYRAKLQGRLSPAPLEGGAAVGAYFATADATNITVTYTPAPSTGTNNVTLNWSARI